MGATYFITDHIGQLMFISPLTGQLLAAPIDQQLDNLLSVNGVHKTIEPASNPENTALQDSCRLPPIYDNLRRTTSQTKNIWVKSLQYKTQTLLAAFSTPAKVVRNLYRIKMNVTAPLNRTFDKLAYSRKYGPNECYLQSEADAKLLRQLGVPFRLVYGVLAPTNMMHAWVEIINNKNHCLLVDQNIDFVNCFQPSLVYDFSPQ